MPAPGPDPGIQTDGEWRQGLLELLTDAVEVRLCRASAVTGSMLSGGMDSGSVVAIGKDLLNTRNAGPLHTYSANIDPDHGREDFAEIRAIEAAMSMDGISPTRIHPGVLQDQFDQMIADLEEPFDGQCMLLKSVYRAAAADGRRVVLDGAGGDVVLGEGTYIHRLLRRGRFATAIREMIRENRFWESDYFWGDAWRRVGQISIRPRDSSNNTGTSGLGRKSRRQSATRWFRENSQQRSTSDNRVECMRQLFTGPATADYATERSTQYQTKYDGWQGTICTPRSCARA